jgi:hypothetical protein
MTDQATSQVVLATGIAVGRIRVRGTVLDKEFQEKGVDGLGLCLEVQGQTVNVVLLGVSVDDVNRLLAIAKEKTPEQLKLDAVV